MLNRKQALDELHQVQEWDIIVIGGGATGLGVAVDAAQRGFKVLLLEKHDFAKGTSSRSTKLVHGGVRYLAQGNIKLVLEALRERGYLLSNAPHLTRVQEFVIPVYSWFSLMFYAVGLNLYDLLSGKLSLGRPAILSRKKVMQQMPMIQPKGLKGGIRYTDGQFDDARLAMTLALTARDLGATLLNYMTVIGLEKRDGKVRGVQVQNELDGSEYTIMSKVVINATGVFVDGILEMDETAMPASVMPSQGVHIVVDQEMFPSTSALMIPKTSDGRVLFAVPWYNKLVVGTTDTPLNIISEEPTALDEEVSFIIGQFNAYAKVQIERTHIRSVFAGLRPLVKTSNSTHTSLASRDHTIFVSPSNLITITGGKWTTYRKMAKDAVNNAAFVAKLPIVKCKTRRLHLHGTGGGITFGEPFSVYGTDREHILELIQNDPALSERVHPDINYTKAEVVWAVKHEMAQTLEDILSRRSRMLLLDAAAAMESAPGLARLMASLLNQDEEWIEDQVSGFTEMASGYLVKTGI